MDEKHVPVLLNEVIEGLNIKPNGIYVDLTLGRGKRRNAVIDFNSFYPVVPVGLFFNFAGNLADRFFGKVILINLEFTRWLFEYDGGHRNFASFVAVDNVSACRVAKPWHIGEHVFQSAPNRIQFFRV